MKDALSLTRMVVFFRPLPVAKAVAKVAPSPQEVDGKGGRHDAMQLAAWGVPWPPPKGWKAKLAELYREQQAAKQDAPPAAQPDDPVAVLMRRPKAELAAEIVELTQVVDSQLERIAALNREAQGATGIETSAKYTAAQIRVGGIEYERQIAIEWLREIGKPGLAAAMEAQEHHGARKRA